MACCYRTCCRAKKYERTTEATRTHIGVQSAKHLCPGDHISFERPGYKHHAIVWEPVMDSDNLVVVIHVTGDHRDIINSAMNSGKTNMAGLQITTLDIGDETVRKYDHTGNLRTDERKPHIVAGQLYRQGLLDIKKYDVASFNCEHFATYCVTGVPYCKQLDTENSRGKKLLDSLVSDVEVKCNIEDINRKREQEQAIIKYIENLTVADHPLDDYEDKKTKTDGKRKQREVML